jgi:hypothetical protein
LTNKAAIGHDIYLANRDSNNAAKILEMTLKARAKNTNTNYIPKQQEFVTWALKSGYHDRETVTEAKILSFLEEEVIHRSLRRRGKKSLAAADVPVEKQHLKWTSVRAYVTAITDLYNAQQARNMNSNPYPRAAQVKALIKALQRRDAAEAKLNFADKGRDTYLDGYSESQFKKLCLAIWKTSSSTSTSTVTVASTGCYLRTLVDLLLGHYLLARGNDRRVAEISDLHTFEFPDEGSTPCFPLIMTMRGSKTNQFGRLETMGAFRNKDPFICPLGTLGFYLLYRWDLTAETFPDFSKRSQWYNIRLLLSTKPKQETGGGGGGGGGGGSGSSGSGGDRDGNGNADRDNVAAVASALDAAFDACATYTDSDDDDDDDEDFDANLDAAATATVNAALAATSGEPAISYNTQRGWIAKVFALIGLSSTKKTHLFRAIGAKLAELKGVSEDQISRAGRWTLSQMMGCYLTSLPHNFMRRMAGHPDQKGCFEIRRAVKPPEELLTMIWPELDQWNERFGPDKIDDLAAAGFCTLLRHLREVVLQDSVFLKEAFPDHFLWSHPVFHHNAYVAFAERLKRHKDEDDDKPSLSTRIIQAMPDLVDNLQSINHRTIHQSKAQEERETEIQRTVTGIQLSLNKVEETLQYITSGGLVWQLRPTAMATMTETPTAMATMTETPTAMATMTETPTAMATMTETPTAMPTMTETPTAMATAMGTLTVTDTATETPTAMALVPPQLTIPIASSIASIISPPPRPLHPQPPPPPPRPPLQPLINAASPPPRYRMRRDVSTVRRLYEEWTIGLHHCLPIGELDRRYGHRWRAGRGDEVQFYSLRVEIMREIWRITNVDGVSEVTAMERLQGRQDRERWTIDKLCKRLRLESKQRGHGRKISR